MDKIKIFALCLVVAVLAAACGNGGAAPSAPLIAPQPTATPTPTPPAVRGPGGGDFHPEIGKITLDFVEAETRMACSAVFPFTLDWDGDTAALAGSGEIDCALTTQQCGDVCVTYHIEYRYHGDLSGSADSSQLMVDLLLDGSLTQYWTDIPPGALVAFTEDNPAVIEGANSFPLSFDFVDGAVFTLENAASPEAPRWVFTLHLGQ